MDRDTYAVTDSRLEQRLLRLADRLRDQKHAPAGLTTLRFTHWQIFFDPDHVAATLVAVVRRLGALGALAHAVGAGGRVA